jgi:S-DNA-T family DNA segregation ATPase FtsK/SpoIIIE
LLEAPEPAADEADAGDEDFDPDEDPLLERAIEVVVQTQTASVSLIQRRLRVGYTRAGRLIDMLERRGIISGYEGSKPRRVLLEEGDLERVLAN